ncbi:MAG: DUF488 domain-containing protein [Alphaproteobacteria bacterium]|jgi:uncharacterized protein (DUF488 family)|nr:DUF488 domain-containing protein [Alphaproteobacteria bacterium]MDP6588407.1 DUF488 domain-containing protein [Alphaproteobacteria bacterium]MDP6818760.1 DUF488 domain-containing protein [Alphaproteobacteria bacterium]|tara:strand:- start:550 stop:1023 length:474 start_codon:yes stop_codon:yes gene_type:complete
MSAARILCTIGHSNHSLEKFLHLLKAHNISTLVDVRSWPSSRRMPHFNCARLQESLAAAGIGYLWFGKELGGKGDGDTLAPSFRSRIRELAALAESEQAAIMCAEEDALRCHRKHLLGKPLTEQGLELVHIRGDGSLIADDALNAGKAAQFSLFTDD